MSTLEILIQAAPAWVTVTSSSKDACVLTVTPPGPAGVGNNHYEIRIQATADKVSVGEAEPGKALPPACPERHINANGSFCLGLDAGNIKTPEEAGDWWNDLSFFFACQRMAQKHGFWPPQRGLSHGNAAPVQLEMESIAVKVGWVEELWDAWSHGHGWLSGDLPRIREKSDMLVNQRSACPRQCTRKGRAVLRTDCPHKTTIFQLLQLEDRRRLLEKNYIAAIKNTVTCCQTMSNCPLA